MTQSTDLTHVSPPSRPAGPNPPAGTQANPSGLDPGVNVSVAGFNPNAPPAEEIEAGHFRTIEDANAAVAALAAAGIPSENVTLFNDPVQARSFLKRYIRRDGDRHSHSGTAPAYAGLIGALACGLLGIATAGQFATGDWGPILGGLVGGVIGAILGGITGGLAFRQADDRSMEIIDNLSSSGPVVAVRCPDGNREPCLEEVGRILARHNGTVMRLNPHIQKADLHPGDTRPEQM